MNCYLWWFWTLLYAYMKIIISWCSPEVNYNPFSFLLNYMHEFTARLLCLHFHERKALIQAWWAILSVSDTFMMSFMMSRRATPHCLFHILSQTLQNAKQKAGAGPHISACLTQDKVTFCALSWGSRRDFYQ